ncbi:MAG: hypothetical protein U9R42_08560 [Bacteroidota bacterium]|nr:hypothetical protein [Bacteroidota bacterium]
MRFIPITAFPFTLLYREQINKDAGFRMQDSGLRTNFTPFQNSNKKLWY